MSKSSFDIVNGVDWLLRGIVVVVLLVIIVKIDEVSIVVVAALPLRAVASEVSLLATLETRIVSPGDVANYSYYESTRLMQNSVIKPS